MKTAKKAILWGRDDLLTRAMEIFLTAGENWDVSKVDVAHGYECLLEHIRSLGPDVIILYTETSAEDPGLLTGLVREQPNLKVILVSLEGNEVQIYDKHSVVVHKAADLLSVIEGRYFPEHANPKEVH